MIPSVEINAKQRVMNYELNRLETLFQKQGLVSSPLVVQLPTGTRCNLRCVFCTERGPEVEARYEHMTLDQFIPLAQGLNWASVVQLWGWGEPFLNPHYDSIFDYVTKHFPGIEINISTNGTLLDSRRQKMLLDYGNISVNSSINAATRETYSLVTGADLFDQMAENLRGFKRMREEYQGRAKTRFTVSFVVVRDNIAEIPDFIDLAADFGACHVQFMDLMHINGSCNEISPSKYADTVREGFEIALKRADGYGISVGSFIPYAGNDYLSINSCEEVSSATEEDSGPVALKPCYEPWKTLLVCSDGTASLCCRSAVVTGNLRENRLEEVWNSDIYKHYRERINSPAPPEICRICPVKIGMSS